MMVTVACRFIFVIVLEAWVVRAEYIMMAVDVIQLAVIGMIGKASWIEENIASDTCSSTMFYFVMKLGCCRMKFLSN